MSGKTAKILAGVPQQNLALFHKVRFAIGDPAAWIAFAENGLTTTEFIVRDIERDRAQQVVRVDRVSVPADYAPAEGLSGDRETATAQALAECLRRNQVQSVCCDRTLPYIYAWHIQQVGIELQYSADAGVLDRRIKDAQELECIRECQAATEKTMQYACELIARANARSDGTLESEGQILTSEAVQRAITLHLIDQGYSNPHGSIVASLPHSADCHDRGAGPLKTGQPVIVDIFPVSQQTHYCGDCTRTVVHGDPTDAVRQMHAAVVAAKQAAIGVMRAGASAEAVHQATIDTLTSKGYRFSRGEIADDPIMPHGTGHGIGLDVHEPILLDFNGGTLLANEVLTVEPGLYSRLHGGVRVEDMVAVTIDGVENFNRLPEGLDWR